MSYSTDNPSNIKNVTLILNNKDLPEELINVEVERNFLAAVKPAQEQIPNPDAVLINEVNRIIQNNAASASSASGTSNLYESLDPDKLINSAFSDDTGSVEQVGMSGMQPSASQSPDLFGIPQTVSLGGGVSGGFGTSFSGNVGNSGTGPGFNMGGNMGGNTSNTSSNPSTAMYSYAAEPTSPTAPPPIPVDELLADISSFRQELTTNDIPIDDIPVVNDRHSYQEILSIRNVLKHKVDRIIAGSLGETFLIEGAKMIGGIFNGERKIGPFRPHLAGWDATVRNKINRHRSSVANLSQGVLNTVGLNSERSIILELLLSAVAYSNMHSKKSLSRDRYNEAAENLRGI